ncbi:class I SAM-dependent methyltransferase [Geothrix sp. SG200]|uniref:class I SAM-dependent methyltransferase n=1 Tax=Geothrix sp. SG200 TaxID=2922865 RepID=UPI001FAC3C06
MSDFDVKAATWDQDPIKVERATTVGRAIAGSVAVEGRTILEYGCGTGLLGFVLQPLAGHVTLADTSAGMLEVLRGKVAATGAANMTPLRLDLLADPLPAGRFDLVCSLMTLHHIPDTPGILEKFHQVLAPGGWVALSDLDAEDGSFHGKDVTDVHPGFDRTALGRQLEAAGFREIRFSTVFEIPRETASGPRRFPVFLALGRKG